MSLNPFSAVSDYSSMLNKIAFFTFAISLLLTLLVCGQSPIAEEALSFCPIQIPILGAKFALGLVLPALGIAIVARITKLHDRVSDLLGIRQAFDTEYILKGIVTKLGMNLTPEIDAAFKLSRDKIMADVFYRYASSGKDAAKIDSHYITLALDQWCWFWIVVEGVVVSIAASVVLLFLGQYLAASVLLFLSVGVGILLLACIWRACIRYADAELDQILSDQNRRDEIHARLHALQSSGA